MIQEKFSNGNGQHIGKKRKKNFGKKLNESKEKY